jgi:hypothetical protein
VVATPRRFALAEQSQTIEASDRRTDDIRIFKFCVTGSADMKLIVYTALAQDRTADKLGSLLAAPPGKRQPGADGPADRVR